jgi:hypothetical protein
MCCLTSGTTVGAGLGLELRWLAQDRRTAIFQRIPPGKANEVFIGAASEARVCLAARLSVVGGHQATVYIQRHCPPGTRTTRRYGNKYGLLRCC